MCGEMRKSMEMGGPVNGKQFENIFGKGVSSFSGGFFPFPSEDPSFSQFCLAWFGKGLDTTLHLQLLSGGYLSELNISL